jgi:hypothetical protein
LFNHPQRNVVEAEQGPGRLELGSNDGEVAGSVGADFETALLGSVPELGK